MLITCILTTQINSLKVLPAYHTQADATLPRLPHVCHKAPGGLLLDTEIFFLHTWLLVCAYIIWWLLYCKKCCVFVLHTNALAVFLGSPESHHPPLSHVFRVISIMHAEVSVPFPPSLGISPLIPYIHENDCNVVIWLMHVCIGNRSSHWTALA